MTVNQLLSVSAFDTSAAPIEQRRTARNTRGLNAPDSEDFFLHRECPLYVLIRVSFRNGRRLTRCFRTQREILCTVGLSRSVSAFTCKLTSRFRFPFRHCHLGSGLRSDSTF